MFNKIKCSNIFKIKSGSTPDTRELSFYFPEEINWLNSGDFHNSIINKTNKKISLKGQKKCGLKEFNSNSIVIAMYGANIGEVGYLNINATVNQACAVLEAKNYKLVNPKYYFYWFIQYKKQFILQSYGGGQDNINQKIIAQTYIDLPILLEQNKIVSYLDIETDKIDKKISILEQKIEKLEEYKQSVIFETVTKGLDKNVEMKDSGIEWIGPIPKDSVTKRIKDICFSLGGGNYGDEEGSEGYSIPCISISDFKNGDLLDNVNIKISRIYKKKNKLKKGTILIEKSGGGEKNPVGRIIYLINDIEAYYTNFVQGIKIIKENPKYINYCLKIIHKNRLHMDYVKQTTGLQNFEFNKFSNNFYLPIHNIIEQEEIANFLDDFSSKIENKVELIKKQIELLKEYKEAIIYEAVTGKMEIL